jgi:hypothetical protein
VNCSNIPIGVSCIVRIDPPYYHNRASHKSETEHFCSTRRARIGTCIGSCAARITSPETYTRNVGPESGTRYCGFAGSRRIFVLIRNTCGKWRRTNGVGRGGAEVGGDSRKKLKLSVIDGVHLALSLFDEVKRETCTTCSAATRHFILRSQIG